jgi:N-acetylmuramoyl-L-alanine amidase
MKRSIIVKIVMLIMSVTGLFVTEASASMLQKISTGGKACSITRVYKHSGSLSEKYVFHFTGNPICTYIPKDIDKKSVEEGKPVTLTFFVPLATIKSGAGKQAIEKMNKQICASDHCVRVHTVTSPMKGIQYDITLRLGKRGLEYQSFTSITGERGVMFKFHDQEALKKVNTKTAAKKIRRLAYAGKKKVIIDYAHGGIDSGYNKGSLREKDINLAIGKKVTLLLKKKGYEVCLTRHGDESLALDERTALAGKCKGAHALISIHTNSAPNSSTASGIETFCHKEDLFTTRLNKADTKLLAHAEQIDKTILTNSNLLARSIHNQVLGHAKKKKADVVDRKVKHKVAQLLLGSDVPSVLLELGFLTNKKEATLLQDKSYQKVLAQGICKGLDDFFNVM